MICTLDWDAPMEPPPDYDIHLTLALHWQPLLNRYHARTPGWPHYVDISFYLDLVSGLYSAHMMAWQWHMLWTSVESVQDYVTPNAHIDLTIDEWLGQLPLNVIKARFFTDFP